jgi:hypothetical protein
VQFFASSAPDTGGGPGQILLATVTTTFNSTTSLLEATAMASPPAGLNFISATVTDPQYNTSQFSAAVPITPGGGRGGGAGAGGSSDGRGSKGVGSVGGAFDHDFSSHPSPNYASGLQPNPVYQWPVAMAIVRMALPEATLTSRPMITARHAQDALFERWYEGVLDALAGNLWT